MNKQELIEKLSKQKENINHWVEKLSNDAKIIKELIESNYLWDDQLIFETQMNASYALTQWSFSEFMVELSATYKSEKHIFETEQMISEYHQSKSNDDGLSMEYHKSIVNNLNRVLFSIDFLTMFHATLNVYLYHTKNNSPIFLSNQHE